MYQALTEPGNEAISRGDLSEKILANDRICSSHFINGKPASLEDETNPDWWPTLNLGHSKVCGNQVQIGERWSRRKAREDASNVALSTATATSSKDDAGEELHDHASSCFSSTEMNKRCDEVDGSVDVQCDANTQTSYTSSSDVGVQTDMSFALVSLVSERYSSITSFVFCIDWDDAE